MSENAESKGRLEDSDFDFLFKHLPVVLTGIIGIVASVVTYFIGRRAKIDDMRIKKGHEHAENLVDTFDKLHGSVREVEQFIGKNLTHVSNYVEIADIVATQPLYSDIRAAIQAMSDQSSQLQKLLPRSRVYLRKSFVDLFSLYNKTLIIEYMSDGGLGISDEFIEKLLENMNDRTKQSRRARLTESIHSKLRNSMK